MFNFNYLLKIYIFFIFRRIKISDVCFGFGFGFPSYSKKILESCRRSLNVSNKKITTSEIPLYFLDRFLIYYLPSDKAHSRCTRTFEQNRSRTSAGTLTPFRTSNRGHHRLNVKETIHIRQTHPELNTDERYDLPAE